MNAAIMISNRNIHRDRNKSNSMFGNGINANGIRVATGEFLTNKNKYNLSLIESNNTLTDLSEFVSSVDNGKPWIFFVHGNNQTPKKNLKKSARIQKLYDANIIMFSWPSRTYGPPKLISYIVTGALVVNPSSRLIGKYLAKKLLKKRIKQYTEAKKLANKSKSHLVDAINLIKECVNPNIQGRDDTQFTMLVHSLGNYLLQVAHESGDMPDFNNLFDSLVLHQADVDEGSHSNWCGNITLSHGENTYITKNKKDAVLFLSGYANTKDSGLDVFSRLGNKTEGETELDNLNYVDFTGKSKVGFNHGIAWDKSMSDEVEGVLRQIITGN